MREIITLQLGPLSNYTGAHFWNLQDEALGAAGGERLDGVAEDVLFSWSEDPRGAPVYRPRAVVVDTSGATGGVSFSLDAPGAPPDASAASSAWGGDAQVVASGRIPKSAFTQQLELQSGINFDRESAAAIARHQAALEAAARQLDALALGSAPSGARGVGVRYWSDYLKVQLHPRSFQALQGAWHGAAGLEGYGAASSLTYGVRPAVEAVADAVRWWSEGCDSLQGVQVFADDLTAFGGLARSVLDELREELPGARILYFSLRPTDSGGGGQGAAAGGSSGSSGGAREVVSDALAVAELSERSAAYVPLRVPTDAAALLPLLRLPSGWRGSNYLCGALLGAAIDTATLPLRLGGPTSALEGPSGATDLHSWVSLLSGRGGANLAAAALQLPVGAAEPEDWTAQRASDARAGEASPAEAGRGEAGPSYRLSTLRNTVVLAPSPPALRLQPDSSLAESVVLRGARRASGLPATARDAAAALDAALRSEPPRRCVMHRCVSPAAVAVPLPFPGIFGPAVGPEGEVVARWSPAAAQAALAAGAGPGSAAAGARDGRHVASCPVLTRVAATSEFGPWLEERARALLRASATAGGRALGEGWGYAGADLEEVGERLRRMAGSYADGSDDDGLDD
ncbi:hypothetical protein Rsub_12708 [Raphidocelis subcapitata]|uniref:Misato Segment II tubulin-like domain-containing protein n=1 Tax=Raphidocelis subcapitata TaxID=307507 RepID=A0A2V0PMB1_9CHLO|nr:hypothetical protein Rsub_12708 [Raphidocelis subcapitata]|eukprot:GBG00223.1 hypothetical protein Rsub_12708 [Raphidocelis subcapitata]